MLPRDFVRPAPAEGVGRSGGLRPSDPLLIRVSTGTGSGPTQLAAFDAALFAAGVAGYNLVRLSSVVPPYAEVREVRGEDQVAGTPGDIAYCVYADAYASTTDERAWAGLGWALHTEPARPGLFVEHSGSSEAQVRRDLNTTLTAMAATRGEDYRIAGHAVSSVTCVDRPVCAVVVATYASAGWSD